MAQRIEINTPDFRVPRIEAPLVKSTLAPVLDQAANSVDYLGKVWDEREEKDGRANAALKLAQIQNKFIAAMSEDAANGKIEHGYTQRLLDELHADGEAARQSDNQHEIDAVTAGLIDIESRLFAHSTGLEVAAVAAKRLSNKKDAINTHSGTVFTDPSQFEGLQTIVADLVDGEADPSRRAALKIEQQTFVENYIRGVIAKDPGKAKNLIASGELTNFGIDAARLPLLQDMADERLRRNEQEGAMADRHARAKENRAREQAADARTRRDLSGEPITAEDVSLAPLPRVPEDAVNRQVKAITSKLPFMTASELDDVINDARAKLRGQLPETQRNANAHVLNAFRQQVQLRKDDPALAARRSAPAVDQAWNAYAADRSPEKLRLAIEETLAAQDVLEISRPAQRIMPKEVAQIITLDLNRAAPEKSYEVLKSYRKAFGEKYWRKAIHQMREDLPPAMRVAVAMKDEYAAELLVETSRQPRDTLLKLKDPAGEAIDLRSRIAHDPRIEEFVATLARTPGGFASAADTMDGVETLARGYMSKNAVAQETAVDFAIKRVVEDNFDIVRAGGPPFRLPKTLRLSAADVARGARALRENIVLTAADVEKLDDGTSHADQTKAFTAIVRGQGYWVTNDNESGAILFAGGEPVMSRGKIVHYRFEDLANAQPHDPPHNSRGAPAKEPPVTVPKRWNGEDYDDDEDRRWKKLRKPR
jgi:hypothetical protein